MCCIVHIEGEKKEKGYRLLIVGRDRLVVGGGGGVLATSLRPAHLHVY